MYFDPKVLQRRIYCETAKTIGGVLVIVLFIWWLAG